jgi:predicted ATPase
MVVISGCSGGGKSTLVAELARRGFRTIEEPGRRIVQEELERGGRALPWEDEVAFLERAIAMASEDYAAASALPGWTFCDRGLVDAASALEAVAGRPLLEAGGERQRYYSRVFLAPPWPGIYATDSERRHGLAEAEVEYERLCRDFPRLGYEIVLLPRVPVSARADFVLARLGAPTPGIDFAPPFPDVTR